MLKLYVYGYFSKIRILVIRSLTHPIKTLAKSMSSNTPDSPALELSGCMEVSVLVDAFNQMNDNLNGHIKCTLLTDYVTMVSKCASLEVYTLKKAGRELSVSNYSCTGPGIL